MTACFVYGKKVADEHLFHHFVKYDFPRNWNTGPLCYRCGLPLGTIQMETAGDFHLKKKGHTIGSGACSNECNDGGDDWTEPWWGTEPWPLQHEPGCPMAAPMNHDHGCGCGLIEEP